MKRLPDGTIVGLPPYKSPTHPRNLASEDTLMMKEVLTKEEANLLARVLDNYTDR